MLGDTKGAGCNILGSAVRAILTWTLSNEQLTVNTRIHSKSTSNNLTNYNKICIHTPVFFNHSKQKTHHGSFFLPEWWSVWTGVITLVQRLGSGWDFTTIFHQEHGEKKSGIFRGFQGLWMDYEWIMNRIKWHITIRFFNIAMENHHF